jgi:hypothetical protein
LLRAKLTFDAIRCLVTFSNPFSLMLGPFATALDLSRPPHSGF